MLLNLRSCSGLSAIQRAENVIDALSPTAWYHMRGSGVPTSSGGFASMWPDMADTDNGLVLPNVASNYASTPDSVPLSITGDIDIRVKVAANDYTPAANTALVGKYTGIGTRSFYFYIVTTGALGFTVSVDGTATVNAASSVATGLTDGSTKWLRVTRAAASGDVKFYTSDDGASWTQLGTTQSTAASAIHDNNAVLEIGSIAAGTLLPFSGRVYRASIYSTIGGTTPVFDADFSAQAKGTTSFTESSSNAATVTVNQSGALPAHIGNKKDLLQGTATNQPAYSAGVITFDGVDNFLSSLSFPIGQPATFYAVMKQVTWTDGDYLFDSSIINDSALRQKITTPNIQITMNSSVADNTDLILDTYAVLTWAFNGASSYIRVNNNAETTGDPGIKVPAGITIGTRGDGLAAWSAMAVKEVIVFAAAHDATQRASVIAALNALNTVF